VVEVLVPGVVLVLEVAVAAEHMVVLWALAEPAWEWG